MFYIANLSLGLLAFLCLQIFDTGIRQDMRSRSRELMGADITMSASRAFSDQEMVKLSQAKGIDRKSLSVEFYAMLSHDDLSRLVQVVSVEDNFPLYGQLKGASYQDQTSASVNPCQNSQLWIYPELLPQLKLAVGNNVNLGRAQFKVAGFISRDPSATPGNFSMAPKVFLCR